jgi:hypothetical protein
MLAQPFFLQLTLIISTTLAIAPLESTALTTNLSTGT